MGSKSSNRRKSSTQSDSSKLTGDASSSSSSTSGSAAELTDLEDNPLLDKVKADIQQGVAHPANDLHEHVEDRDDSWETESLLQDMLEGATEEEHMDGTWRLHPIGFHLLTARYHRPRVLHS